MWVSILVKLIKLLLICTIISTVIIYSIPKIINGESIITPELKDELIRGKALINGTLTQEHAVLIS